MKKLPILFLILFGILFVGNSQIKFPKISFDRFPVSITTKEVLKEEPALTSAIEKALPSVVTIGISKTTAGRSLFEFDPFDPFSPFDRNPGRAQKIEQNIGSGFVIAEDGLIVTNKHVVEDQEATYKVLTVDGKKYPVTKISRDPLNDLAILKISTRGLKVLKLGDSSYLKLGQSVVAIGTPLGEFTNTVTAGIISGLKRGINAGSPFEQYVERLDNVIQTDAAINPGNSGGPLINLSGEAIGVNTAVSSEGQNIGFAIPISVVQDLIKNFNKTGGVIERPFLGIRYQMISRQTAVINDLPEGAYIIEVVKNSPAEKSGLRADDIITDLDNKRIKGDDDQVIQKLIVNKKIGQTVTVKIWRDGKTLTKTIVLRSFE